MGTEVKDKAALLRLRRPRKEVTETRDQVWRRRTLFQTLSLKQLPRASGLGCRFAYMDRYSDAPCYPSPPAPATWSGAGMKSNAQLSWSLCLVSVNLAEGPFWLTGSVHIYPGFLTQMEDKAEGFKP